MIKPSRRTVLLSRHPAVDGNPGVLQLDGKDELTLTLGGNKDLKWSAFQGSSEHA